MGDRKSTKVDTSPYSSPSHSPSSPPPSSSSPPAADPPSSPTREFSLYVSDIARGVTDEDLKQAFSKHGNVVDAIIVKNKYTLETKGYGFVRFHSMDDVYNTLDSSSLPKFEDSVSHKMQTVKITVAEPKHTLYIGNIPQEWEEEDVLRVLREVGREEPRKFRFGHRKTHGYVTYIDHETAVAALKNIQRPPAGSSASPLTAYLAPPKFADSKATFLEHNNTYFDKSPSTKVLFVRGTTGVTQNTLLEIFGGPEVVEKVIVPHGITKRPLGHSFIHYYSSKHAAAAMAKYNNYEYDGHKFTIEWCHPKTPKLGLGLGPGMVHPFAYPYAPPYPYYQDFYPYYDPYLALDYSEHSTRRPYGYGSSAYPYPRLSMPHYGAGGSAPPRGGGKSAHSPRNGGRFLPY